MLSPVVFSPTRARSAPMDLRAWLLVLAASAALAGCGKPTPPDKERPPEPQAAHPHTQLRDAMQAPVERAQQAETDTLNAAEAQRAAIDAASGG